MIQSIVFRAEASNQLGLGHMFRCLNFVRSLDMEINPCFVMKECQGKEKIIQVLTDHNWKVYFLPQATDLESDAVQTAKIAEHSNAGLVVTDLCHRYCIETPDSLVTYHRNLKKLVNAFVLSIEDCRMSGFSSNAAIIWNSNNTSVVKAGALDDCRILAGTRYFICDPKFSSFDPKQLQIRETANRILVCIGGSDPNKITLKVLKAIKKIGNPAIKARVITGSGMSVILTENIDQLAGSADNIEIIRQTNSMIDLLTWADIAVVGEGLLKYEAAITGTPSLMIPQFDHNSTPIVEFLKIGCSQCINTIRGTDIAAVLSGLLTNYETRRTMSANGLRAVDGKGMQRIYSSVLKKLVKC